MALLSLQDVSLGFGGPRLFDGINLQIEQGEWLGLLGRNGMGKSTLLKLVNGDIEPLSGSVSRQQNLRTAYLPQEVPAGIVGKVFDIVADGLDAPHIHDEHHWQGQLQVEQVISRMLLDADARFKRLIASLLPRLATS